MKKSLLFILLIFSFSKSINAQAHVSVYSEISIVTAGPGTELYEAFGHSAIRLKDPVLNIDLIYNYGIFDFKAPNFYTNFAKGYMLYSLARYDFKYFLASYKKDKRWLKQQVLNLTHKEKQAFFMYLENNALPENKNYLYDPYFDNCATKLKEITKTILKDKVSFNEDYENLGLSFRDLTNKEIYWNTWGSFGLNLIAGIKLDKKATSEEYLFLPDYIYDVFKNATINNENTKEKLVKREDILLNFKESKPKFSIFNPLIVISFISFIGLFITYNDYKKKKRSKYLDFTLFFISGIIGCILFFFWFFSSHTTAPHNYNILWAFPLNLFVGFVIIKNNIPKWALTYTKFLVLLLLCIPFLWILKIQVYPIALLPLFVLYLFRYFILSKSLIK